MNVLGLDFGTSTGYCYNVGEKLCWGHWTLATKKEIREWGLQRLTRRRDPRPQRLCDAIFGLKFVPDLIVFEDIMFASSTLQVQLWSALRTSLWVCLGDDVRFDCVNVTSLKKFAVAGNATKDMMRAALDRVDILWKGVTLTDDEVDAIWLWKWSQHNLGRT